MYNQSKYFAIGIDVGTTSVKISAMTPEQSVLKELQIDYEYTTYNQDWNEIEPDKWWDIVLEGLQRLAEEVSFDYLIGIGVTGQMHTTVFLDEHGESIRPAILWNDRRTKNQIPNLQEKLRLSDATQMISKMVSTGSPLANLLWVKSNEKENYENLEHLLITPNYITYRLTNNFSLDHCDASTSSMYSFESTDWSKDVIEMFDLKKTILPDIKPASKILGELTDVLKEKFDINHSVPVIVGTGDNIASALSNDGFSKQNPIISLGTSGVMVIPNDQYELKETGKNVIAGIYSDDHYMITQGSIQAGAKSNEWWGKDILQFDDYNTEQAKINKENLGRNTVLFSPHLNGEKTLFANPNLKSSFYGMDLNTSREDLYLSVLEGVAFGLKMLYDSMKTVIAHEQIVILGGGAKSELWVKIFANVFNTPMKKSHSNNEAVHGIAKLVLETVLNIENESSNEQYDIVYPDAEISERYKNSYKIYKAFINEMNAFSKTIATIE